MEPAQVVLEPFSEPEPEEQLPFLLTRKLAVASLILWFCLSLLLVAATGSYFSEEPHSLILNAGETRLISPNNLIHLRITLTDLSSSTKSYIFTSLPQRVNGPSKSVAQTVVVPLGHFHEWARYFLTNSKLSLIIQPQGTSPFVFCMLRGTAGYEQYLNDGSCNIYRTLINQNGIYEPVAPTVDPLNGHREGFRYSHVVQEDDVYYVILENNFELKKKEISMTITLDPVIYQVDYALDFESGSFKQDIPFNANTHYVVCSSEVTATVQYEYEPRAVFVWFVFAATDTLLLLGILLVNIRIKTRLGAPSSLPGESISKGLQLLTMENQQVWVRYFS